MDSAEGHSLHERERKGKTREKRRLMFEDMWEGSQSDLSTTKDVGNPDDSTIDLVGE